MQDSVNAPVRLQIVPWSAGRLWFSQGVKSFAKQPFALGGVFLMSVAMLQLIMLVPLVGPLVWVVLSPALSVGFMAAMGTAHSEGRPKLTHLFVAFRSGRPKLVRILQLGALNIAGVLVIALSTSLFFSDETASIAQAQLAQLESSSKTLDTNDKNAQTGNPPGASAENKNLPKGSQPVSSPAKTLSVGMVLYIVAMAVLVTLLSWHAPGLVFWHNVSPFKAMFFSAFTCLRNFGAMATYMGVWALALVPIAFVNYTIQASGNTNGLWVAIFFPINLMVVAVFALSSYFTFRGSFENNIPIP